MEEEHVALESANDESNAVSAAVADDADHGWKTVSYVKRRKNKNTTTTNPNTNNNTNGSNSPANSKTLVPDTTLAVVAVADNAFSSLEPQSEQILDVDNVNSSAEKEKAEESKKKESKVTVVEAAEKIDPADLSAFLAHLTTSYHKQHDIQMMRLAEYFGVAFASVSASQFPWLKLLRESTVANIADVPLSQIPDAVYIATTRWIKQRSLESLSSFLLWSLDSILADVASKSQVATFSVLAMALRTKPDALITILPSLRDDAKYQGQDKVPVIVWMVAQASEGDLSVGLYAWARNLLPSVSIESGNDPKSRDLVLQVVENILSAPKAGSVLLNGAVRKRERLVPPTAFEILMRVTFPLERTKDTERLECIYPIVKELALGGSPGSKAMKKVAEKIFGFAIRAAGEKNAQLSTEAAGILIWCLTQSIECYKQWRRAYEDNIEASVLVLKKISDDWNKQSARSSSHEALRETLKNFTKRNQRALATGTDASRREFFRDAEKCCKVILERVSGSHGCTTCLTFTIAALAVGAAFLSSQSLGILRSSL